MESIVSVSAPNHIVAGLTVKFVIARVAVNRIVAVAAAQSVIARPAVDGVIQIIADDLNCLRASGCVDNSYTGVDNQAFGVRVRDFQGVARAVNV